MLKKILVIFALFLIIGGAIGIYIEKTLEPKTRVISTIYVVQKGDTLIDICWTYQNLDYRHPYIFEFMDEIKDLNPFLEDRKDNLQVGDKILIQYLERE